MTLVVWSPETRRHLPGAEIWVGVNTPGTEVPERVDTILDALDAAGARRIESVPHDDDCLTAVHSPELVAHLATIHARWMASEIPGLVGQNRVVPYFFATEAMLGGLPGRVPPALQAVAGVYAYDTMTLVGEGTWEAVRAAADCALTAVDLVAGGERSAYALCRPPGHHVTQAAYGGSCYLNNAAIAAAGLRRAGHDRVAIVDVDAHHGNGTAAIFYDRAGVFYGSVHVDPGAGWFPHVVGYPDETGVGAGAGTTLNLPLAPGTGDDDWLRAVARLAEAVSAFGATALVVSLGVDAAADDPESPLQVTAEGYRAAARLLAGVGIPAVHVQEGGYHLPTLGVLVAAFLDGFRQGEPRPGSSTSAP
jgi:acetoin utilization deacetylase AcuC-like enzyme